MSFKSKFSAVILLVAAFCFSAFGQAFEKAERNASADGETVNFKFTSNGVNYQVTGATGAVTSGSKKFDLPRDKSAGVDHIKFARYQKDMLILFEQDFGGESGGVLARIGEGGKVRWTRKVPSFNLAGSMESNFAYVGGVGYVTKINVANGSVVWKTDNFYNDQHGKIDVPAAPQITDRMVVLTQSPDSANGANANVVINFDKNTGKIKRYLPVSVSQ